MEASHPEFRNRVASVDFTRTEFRPSIYPHLRIRLNFSLTLRTSIWILDQDSTILPFTGELGPSSQCYDYSIAFIVRGPFTYDDVRVAIENAVRKSAGEYLLDAECRSLSVLALEELRGEFSADRPPKHINLSLEFDLVVETRHLTESDDDDDPRMVPAANSSLRLLETVDCCSSTVGCCICLKESPGAAALRMPCSHVFHGACIQEWLRRSHYCPLCRYQMPTK